MSYPMTTNQSRPMSQGNYQGSGDLPMGSAKEQMLMWQQNFYMNDSGIHSGAVTQAPSLSGKEDEEMEGDQLMFDLDQGFAQGFTLDQVDEMNQQLSHTRIQLPNLQDVLGPEQDYDGMYGQGPSSVHSSHGGRGYQSQGYDQIPVDSMQGLKIGGGLKKKKDKKQSLRRNQQRRSTLTNKYKQKKIKWAQ